MPSGLHRRWLPGGPNGPPGAVPGGPGGPPQSMPGGPPARTPSKQARGSTNIDSRPLAKWRICSLHIFVRGVCQPEGWHESPFSPLNNNGRIGFVRCHPHSPLRLCRGSCYHLHQFTMQGAKMNGSFLAILYKHKLISVYYCPYPQKWEGGHPLFERCKPAGFQGWGGGGLLRQNWAKCEGARKSSK